MKTKTKLTKETIANLLSGMSRDERRALAKRFDIPRGKSDKDTLNNLAKAAVNEKFKFTALVYVKTLPSETSKFGDMVYQRKVRNLANKEDRVAFPISLPSEDAPSLAPVPVNELLNS